VLDPGISNAISLGVLGLCLAAVLWMAWHDRHRDD
jgi:hypothetical protein